MSVRFDAVGDYLTRATAPGSTFTMTAWVYVSVDRNDYQTICRHHDQAAGGSTIVTWATESDGLGGPWYFSTSGSFGNATNLAVGDWRKVAIVKNGTTGKVYINTIGGTTEVDSGTVAAGTPLGLTIGARSPADTSEWFNGRVAYVRTWTVELTQTEIEAEWASATAIKTANLWADWPLTVHTDLTDKSGNARNLTGAGTLTTEADPPLSSSTTGVIAGNLPTPTGTLAASNRGLIAGSLPTPTGALAGGLLASGALSGSLPAVTGSISGAVQASGAIAGSLPTPIGAMSASVTASGAITGTLPAATGNLAGTVGALGLLAGTLPGLDGELTGDASAGAAISGSLPTPTGSIAGALSAAGALAGVLPTPSGALNGSVAATGSLAGSLPTPIGALTAGAGTTGAVSGSLPTPSGSLTGVVDWRAAISGSLPTFTGALSGIIASAGVISGSLPAPTQGLTGVIVVTGLVSGSLPSPQGGLSDVVYVSPEMEMELAIYRINTSEFIKADPISISLKTRESARSATGGVVQGDGATRPEQTFKLIMQSPAGGSIEQRTQDGTERQVDFILLGEWDAKVEVGDYWDDSQGNRWEVKALIPFNGYETRAVVEAHGKVLTGG